MTLVDELYEERAHYTRGEAERSIEELILELCDLLAEATSTW